MTRFNITLQEGVQMVLDALKNSIGGELFVPKIPSYRILDIVEAIAPNCKMENIGIRPGEKIHEEMITEADSFNTYEIGNKYIILPNKEDYKLRYQDLNITIKKVPEGFSYNSFNNEHYLTVEEIRKLIKSNIDPKFYAHCLN